jgi:hypothetical protein
VRPLACIPNISPSQARFKKGPQKCHPRALEFDDVIHNLRCSGVAFDILLWQNVALTFEGPSAEGVNLNIGVDVLCDSSDGAC